MIPEAQLVLSIAYFTLVVAGCAGLSYVAHVMKETFELMPGTQRVGS